VPKRTIGLKKTIESNARPGREITKRGIAKSNTSKTLNTGFIWFARFPFFDQHHNLPDAPSRSVMRAKIYQQV
jgi:hypothetical protein